MSAYTDVLVEHLEQKRRLALGQDIQAMIAFVKKNVQRATSSGIQPECVIVNVDRVEAGNAAAKANNLECIASFYIPFREIYVCRRKDVEDVIRRRRERADASYTGQPIIIVRNLSDAVRDRSGSLRT